MFTTTKFIFHSKKYCSKETIGDVSTNGINVPYSTYGNDINDANAYTSSNVSGNNVPNYATQSLKLNNEKGQNQEILSNQTNKLKSESNAYRNLLFKFINSKPNTDLEVQYTPNNDNTGSTIILKAKGISGNQKYQSKGNCKSKLNHSIIKIYSCLIICF